MEQLGQIDAGQLEVIANLEAPPENEDALDKSKQPTTQPASETSTTEPDDFGVAATTIKGSWVLFEGPIKARKLSFTVKVIAELVSVASTGTNDGKMSSVNFFYNEGKLETKGLSLLNNLKASVKTSLVQGKLTVLGKPLEIKFFEAGVESPSKGAKSYDLVPKLDLVKASTYFSLRDTMYSKEAGALQQGGLDLRIKVELSLPITSVAVPDADAAALKTIANAAQRLADKIDDFEQRTGKSLGQSLADKIDNTKLTRGRLGNDLWTRAAKQELRALIKEFKATQLLAKTMTPLGSKLARKVVASVACRAFARFALGALKGLTRLVPYVGWAMFAYDVLELAWAGYKLATGQAQFALEGSENVSLLDDIWKGITGDDTNPSIPEGTETTTVKPTDAEKQLNDYIKSGDPVSRLLKGVARQFSDDGSLEPRHLERLMRIVSSVRLSDAVVDKLLAMVVEQASTKPDAVLDLLEQSIQALSRKPNLDTNGDGRLDAVDLDGDGDADGFDVDGDGYADYGDFDGDGKFEKLPDATTGDGRDKGGTGAGKGGSGKGGSGKGGAGVGAMSRGAAMQDPYRSGLIRMMYTTDGIVVQPSGREVMTRSGAVICIEARIAALTDRVVGSDGDRTFTVIARFVGVNARGKRVEFPATSFDYAWRANAGRFITTRQVKNELHPAVADALNRGVKTGTGGGISFKILKIEPLKDGKHVLIEITKVTEFIVRTVGDKEVEYEVGQTEWVRTYNSK